jgi:hypothetical protein
MDKRTNTVLQVLADSDVGIMSDMTSFYPMVEGKWIPCYYIGWPCEHDAGIHGGCISPTFLSADELEEWVLDHRDVLDKLIQQA